MNWTILTGALAIYGAGISTWNLISKQSKEQRRLKIKTSGGAFVIGSELGPESIVITAQNVGHRTVAISAAGIFFPDRSTYPIYGGADFRFPHDLESGKSCTVLVECHSIALALKQRGHQGVVKIEPFFRDALDEIYSREVEFGVEPWLRSQD